MRLWFVGTLCLLALAVPVTAKLPVQDPIKGLTIGIENEPGDVAVGGIAKFTGATISTTTLGGDLINVKIVDPNGRIIMRSVRTLNDHTFVFSLDNCVPGTYRVLFRGADEQGGVERTFNVIDWDKVRSNAERKFREELDRAIRIAEAMRRRVNSAPDGPNRDEARQRLDQIATQHRQVRDGVNRMLAAASALERASASGGELRTSIAETLSDFSAAASEFERSGEEMKAFEARTRDTPGTCDSLETAAEGLKFFATATQAMLKPYDLLKDAIKDKIIPKKENANPPPNEDVKFALNTAKTEMEAARAGMDGVIRSLPGLARSTSEFVIDKLFKNYCSVIEGPVTAEFSVDAKDNGKPFYAYTVKLEAKMKLWADKSRAAGPQGLDFSGRLEGGVTKVDFKENIFNVEKLPKGSQLIAKKSFTPPVMKKQGENLIGSGQIARMLNPGHFNVRYLGTLNEAGMKLKQESVSDDFTSAFVNRVLVVAILPGAILPGVKNFNFPIQKGAWIIDRSTKGPFELPRTPDGAFVILKKDVERHEVTGNGNIKVDWKVNWNLKGDK